MSAILDNSLVVCGVRGIDRWISQVYSQSKTHCLCRAAKAALCAWFRYSFLGRWTELSDDAAVSPAVWQNSYVVQGLLRGYKRAGVKLRRGYNNSNLSALVRSLRGEFRADPALALGLVLTVAILVNSGLSLALGREIRAWGWFMRGAFLFAGICFLFCQAGWDNIKQASIVLHDR